MGTFRLYVRFPDGEIWHGVYDSVTDEAARFLTPAADDVAGWAMEDDYREDGDLDGQGDPVDIATDYGDFHWHGTALRLPGPGRWCWLTGPVSCDDETTIRGTPDWLVEHLAQSAQPEYPPRAWPRTAGVFHVQFDESAHPVSECTDACRAVDGAPYVARPGWIVRVQAFTPLRDPGVAGPLKTEGCGDG